MAEGYKDWSAGEILTAADLEDYTVKQSVMRFADSSARTTALSGVLAEGMVSYLKDTDSVEVYDGSAWAAVGGGGGLVFISRTTIGSAVSSVTVSGAFSTDYDAYKIIVTGGTASANGTFTLKLGATTAGYKYQQLYGTYSGTSGALGNGASSHWAYAGAHLTVGLEANIDLDQPFLTTRSFYRCFAPFSSSAGWVGGYLDNATSYTAFTLTTSTGTITGGNVDVYGYVKA
jgi:hypothetical protein